MASSAKLTKILASDFFLLRPTAEEPAGRSQAKLMDLRNRLRRGSGLACSRARDEQEYEKCCEAGNDKCGSPGILSSLRHLAGLR